MFSGRRKNCLTSTRSRLVEAQVDDTTAGSSGLYSVSLFTLIANMAFFKLMA